MENFGGPKAIDDRPRTDKKKNTLTTVLIDVNMDQKLTWKMRTKMSRGEKNILDRRKRKV